MPKKKRNLHARNFGLRSRCIDRAAKHAIHLATESHSSAATLYYRWLRFSRWLKRRYAIKDLRKIQRLHLLEYGDWLLDEVEDEALAPSTAQNYLSAINQILSIAREDDLVYANPVKDCGIPKRSGICDRDKSTSVSDHQTAIDQVDDHLAALLNLQRHFGLRFEESCKLDAKNTLKQALSNQLAPITEGTKGGRPRKVPITTAEQIDVLKDAAKVQLGQSMIPPDDSYKTFRNRAYRTIETLPVNFHGERHHYAQTRYQDLTGFNCPIKSGIPRGKAFFSAMAEALSISLSSAKSLDKQARQTISQELVHNRINITNSYLG